MESKWFIRVALLTAGAAVLVMLATRIRQKRQVAEQTVDSIHEQLDALDPATRAAVIARLEVDEIEKVRKSRS